MGCYRTLGRVDAMQFLSDAVSCFVFGVGSLCRAALWCSVQINCPAQSCEFVLFLSGGGLSGGNEHVWLFTRRDLLPLVSTSAHQSTPFHMLHVALQGVRVQVNCLLWLKPLVSALAHNRSEKQNPYRDDERCCIRRQLPLHLLTCTFSLVE